MLNRYNWTRKEMQFIMENFHKTRSMEELAGLMDWKLCLHTLRLKCYELGLKRMEIEYWTTVQVRFLINNYTKIGDKELAEIFNKKWPKQKGWTKKHIEKKRKYLKLVRTKKQIKAIHERNVEQGRFSQCPVNAWKIRGVFKEGTIRYWKKSYSKESYPVIKINGQFVHWNRWAWEQTYGPVPNGMNVVFKDNDPYNLTTENLELLSDGELSQRNSMVSSQGLSDKYIAGILTHKNPTLRSIISNNKSLLELKRKQLQLNRTINEHQKIK